MSGAYQPHFARELSPLSPASGTSATNFRANVNRQRSRKWVEAKKVDYGGDEWGDDDDYDDPYDTTPPPSTNYTESRQPGQVMQPLTGSGDPNKKAYGKLPALPGASQQRVVTAPIHRANSFDKDDERRAFSSGSPAHGSPAQQPTSPRNGPASRFSQMGIAGVSSSKGIPKLQLSTQEPIATGINKSELPPLPREASFGRESDVAQTPLTAATTSSKYSEDYQARQDYSPSAVPLPLSTVISPIQNPFDPQGSRFPPRKSSLSQMSSRDEVQEPQSAIEPSPKPWAEDRSSSPAAAGRARSGSTPTKALPFIRPADIYRRMEEEKERERRSSESGRPSLDSLLGSRPANRSMSPVNRSLRERSSSESFSKVSRSQGSVEGFQDSSRRLMPLEAVQERKSEYGFDGFNLNDPQIVAANTHENEESTDNTTPQITATDEQGHPVEGPGPQLADINRLSGFGSDLFAQTRPHNSGQDHDVEHSDQASHASADNTLKSQPSLGFHSAVQEAFNRGEPMTPISAGDSGVRRSDSESTGTTGISPIMSRVPSVASTEAKIKEAEARQAAIPVIPEAEEPQSQRSSRVITPPLPVNTGSPARTPGISIVNDAPQSAEAQMSEASAVPSSASSIGDSFSNRPAVGREQSFRPQLPGGWISYAGSEATVVPEENQSSRAPSRLSETVSPNLQPSTDIEQSTKDLNQASTLGGNESLQSAATIPASVSLEDVAGPTNEALAHVNEVLPTPDANMAPAGNPYSSPVDSRLFGNAPVELPAEVPAGLSPEHRPMLGDHNLSAVSSAGPTPPPKDTPVINIKDTDSDYFPPTVPLKQRTEDEVAANEQLEPPERPHILPTLSTDTRPQDDENDRLRKEIVRSLSPRSSNAHEHKYGDDLSPHSPSSTSGGDIRDSAYLPSEYENYWAAQGDDSMQPYHLGDPHNALVPTISNEVPLDGETPPIPPLSSRRISKQIDQEPALLVSQFSWGVDKESAEENEQLPAKDHFDDLHPEPLRTPDKRVSFAATPDSQLLELEETREAYFGHAAAASHSDGPHELESPDLQSEQVTPPHEVDLRDQQEPKTLFSESPIASQAVLPIGREAPADTGLNAANQAQDSNSPQRRPSLTEEQSSLQTLGTEHPISSTPPENEHPIDSSQDNVMDGLHPVVSNNSVPHSQRLSQSKITPFKDILAMSDYNQRIRTYDSTRDQFAAMNTGLTDWLVYLKAQHPEHADNNGSYGGGMNYTTAPSSTRAKFSKTIGISSSQTSGQQPYYQQYLNASPASSNPPTPAKASDGVVGYQQHHLVGAHKISSQQVQAKSKELLHTAGVFGGKASNIGKGLFAKGKSRFRGGGGDKTSQPDKPNQPEERRSSWAHLAFSRSTARPGDAPQSQQEATTPMPQRTRRLSAGPSKFDGVETPGSSKSRSASINFTPIVNSRSVDFLRENLDQKHRTDKLDSLAGPVPISKQQPSWDPLNATPIEEEGSGYFDSHMQNPGYYDIENQLSPDNGSILDGAELLERQSTVSDQSGIIEPQMDITEAKQDHTDFLRGRQESPDIEKQLMLLGQQNENQLMMAKQEQDGLTGGRELVAGVQDPDNQPIEGTPTQTLLQDIVDEREVEHNVSEHQSLEDQPNDAAATAGPVVLGYDNINGEPETVLGPHSGNVQEVRDSSVLQDKTLKLPSQHTRNVSDPPMMYSDALKPSAEYLREEMHIPGVTDKKQKGRKLVQHPASFGMPPVRRNSAFGFNFGLKSKERFPIDDDDSEDEKNEKREEREREIEKEEREGREGKEVVEVEKEVVEAEEQEKHSATYVPNGQDWEPVIWGADEDDEDQVGESTNKQALNDPNDEPRTPVLKTAALDSLHISPRTNIRGGPVELPGSEPSRSIGYSGRRGSLAGGGGTGETFDKDRRQHSSTPLLFDRGLFGRPNRQPSPAQLQVPSHEPPSSAQRFPDLFRPKANEELPTNQEMPRHYPAPLTRDEAMLPRQQGTEYMIPGVGPPEGLNKQLSRSRRSSSFIRGISGRLSRNASRERGSRPPSQDRVGLTSRDGPKPGQTHTQPVQNPEQNEGLRSPTPTSEAYRTRRASSLSLLHVLSRTNTSTPDHASSMSQRNSTSRPNSRDMLKEGSKPIVTAQEGRKKLNKAARQSAPPPSTVHAAEPQTETKKKRFSGLVTFLSRRGSAHRPRLNSNGTSVQRGSVSEAGSPALKPAQLVQKSQEARPRRTLTKPPPMGENRSRRNSVTQVMSPVETETLNRIQQSRPPFRHGSVSNGSSQVVKAEPVYETPPIPQAYNLVHGEGNLVSSTTYDPRGLVAQRRQSLPTWQQGGNGILYPPPRPRAQYFDPNVYDPLSIAHGSPAENTYGTADGGVGYEYFGPSQNPPQPQRQNSYHIPMFRRQDSNMSGTAGEMYDEPEKNERSLSRLSNHSLSNRSAGTRSYTDRRDSYEMPGPRNRRMSPSPVRVGMAISEGYPPPLQAQQSYAPSDTIMGSPPRRRDSYELPTDRANAAGLSPSRAQLNGLPSLREHVIAQAPPRMGMAVPMGQVPKQPVGFQGYAAWERNVHGMNAGHGMGVGQSERPMDPWSGGWDAQFNMNREPWLRNGFVAGPAVPRKD